MSWYIHTRRGAFGGHGAPAGAGGPLDGITVKAHWDFSVTGSLTLSGSEIIQANDLSGNGFHLTPSGSGPSSGTRTINGLDVADFDGTTSLEVSLTGVSASDYIISIAVQIDTTTGYTDAIMAMNSTPWYTKYWQIDSNDNGGNFDARYLRAGGLGSSFTLDPAGTVSGLQLYTYVFDFTNSDIYGRRNLTPKGSVTDFTTAWDSNMVFSLARGASGTPVMNCAVCEVVIAEGSSASDRDTIESYLKSKWGTP